MSPIKIMALSSRKARFQIQKLCFAVNDRMGIEPDNPPASQ